MPRVSWLCKVSDLAWLRAYDTLKPEDIDEGWLSVTIKKIIKYVGDHIAYLEGIGKDPKNPISRAERAETLDHILKLQKSSGELVKMEEKRDARLAKKHKGRTVEEKRSSIGGKAAALRAHGRGRSVSRKSH